MCTSNMGLLRSGYTVLHKTLDLPDVIVRQSFWHGQFKFKVKLQGRSSDKWVSFYLMEALKEEELIFLLTEEK